MHGRISAAAAAPHGTLKTSPFFWERVTLVSGAAAKLALGQMMPLPSHLMSTVFSSVISST